MAVAAYHGAPEMLSGDWVASLDGLGEWDPLLPNALTALERSAELNINGGQTFLGSQELRPPVLM